MVVKATAGANNAPTKSAKATKAHTLAENKRFIERFLLIKQGVDKKQEENKL